MVKIESKEKIEELKAELPNIKLMIKEKAKKYAILFLIALLVEIILFNYPAIRTLIVGNRNINADFTIDENKIQVNNLNVRATSFTINYKDELTDKVTYSVNFVAEDNSAEIILREKVILPQNKQCVNFDTHAKANKINIELFTNSEINVESIIINSCNFDLSIYRIFIIFFVAIFIYNLINKSLYKEKFLDHESFNNQIFILNLIVFSLIVVIYVFNQFGHKNPLVGNVDNNESYNSVFIMPKRIDKQDSILMQAEAIVNGQIKLLEEPSKELKEMKIPYDSDKRDKDGVPYLYDTAFYKGNYYNYFGIAPIILLAVPFRLIFGKYLCTHLFNLVFIIGIIFGLYNLYKKLIKKYIKEISLCNFYLGYFAILFASNFLTLLRGAKYDIVVSSGIMFLLISLNLAMSIYENQKFKYLKLILLGITTGLIVLSKPNFIVYYLLIAYLVISSMKNLEIKNKISDSIFIFVPLGILAICQMILNYVRFDSIFEFGARYQLTGFNMNTCMSITFGKIIQGIGEYIFKTPTLKLFTFPFVFINTDTLDTALNELCYENRLLGLIAIPIFWIYLFVNSILIKNKDKEFNWLVIISLAVSLISIIINTCFAGICELYSLDFKMILAIIAVVLFNKAIITSKDKDLINKLFLIATIVTILIMIPISFTTEGNFLTNNASTQTVFLKNIFEFWN